MKLPRLGDPVTTRYHDHDSTTEITVASQFDLLPTWTQYLLIGSLLASVVALGVCGYLEHHHQAFAKHGNVKTKEV